MREDGYSRYACDVRGCDHVAFALPGTAGAEGYAQRRRVDAQGMERKALLCPQHAAAYDRIARAADAAYDAFGRTGEADVVTRGDLDALQARLDEAERARRWWGDRYRALEAEYKAYREAHGDAGTGVTDAPANGAEGGGA